MLLGTQVGRLVGTQVGAHLVGTQEGSLLGIYVATKLCYL